VAVVAVVAVEEVAVLGRASGGSGSRRSSSHRSCEMDQSQLLNACLKKPS
jgi:hypothetical protein